MPIDKNNIEEHDDEYHNLVIIFILFRKNINFKKLLNQQ